MTGSAVHMRKSELRVGTVRCAAQAWHRLSGKGRVAGEEPLGLRSRAIVLVVRISGRAGFCRD